MTTVVMMTEQDDDQLLTALARRNWYILGGLTLLSLLWGSLAVTKGVVAGGLLAIIAYGWLYRSVAKTLANPDKGAPRRYQRAYVFRLAVIGTVIYLLIAKGNIHPLALSAGLSVVVLNLFWTTFRRMI